ncbi:hypothetical protein C5167_032215 [Papaver somniferum]|uniref:Myb/SANT-like domain-containing protein n=1 Tax=Papaver somniferum TaxID=3469 RepID=A0A4Y7K716_PAPSO|nr:hypothetical protein C5167_032215 [Papaver somniferum]
MEKKEDEKANKITFRSVPEFRGLFIDQCLAQATEHGFSRTSLKQTSWGNLCKFFSEKYDCTITQKYENETFDMNETQVEVEVEAETEENAPRLFGRQEQIYMNNLRDKIASLL